jgi:hypothetical protein
VILTNSCVLVSYFKGWGSTCPKGARRQAADEMPGGSAYVRVCA